MGYYKRRSKRKESTAQALARYKRQRIKQERAREARRIRELEDRMPGGILNPITPTWCSFDKYSEIMLAHRQERYRGTTRVASSDRRQVKARKAQLPLGAGYDARNRAPVFARLIA